MAFNIVLIEPEIPNNTGNIGRLALGTGATLHLVKPFGFELSDKRLKRAGLDYWQHLQVIIYENTNDFFKKNADKEMVFFTTKSETLHWNITYKKDMYLIFGKESVGLPDSIVLDPDNTTAKIPLFSPHIRSFNLANAVAISVYEGLRQLS